MKSLTPSDIVKIQGVNIATAIDLLQKQLDAMTATVNLNTESWREAGKYAHVSEAAKELIERLS